MKSTLLSWVLVVIQFWGIFFFLIDGSFIAGHPIYVLLQIMAVLLGIWAIAAMGARQFSVFPKPVEKARLITKGPYRIIRHPMYTAILLMAGVLTADQFNIFRCSVFLLLCINQVIKLFWEERMLKEKMPEYADYMKKTWRLIPYVF
ncbi:MAG: isoprenylcysteine carboxylmethyltransferase family protein [Bacteroidia bacterium]